MKYFLRTGFRGRSRGTTRRRGVSSYKKTSCAETVLSRLLRKGPKEYLAMAAGIGSLTPSITLIIAAFALPEIGLRGVYALFGAIAIAGTIGASVLLQNSILDQLRASGVPDASAKEIAKWMGQKLQSNPELSLLQRLNSLNKKQIHALIVACVNYITTFGILLAVMSTGTLTLSRRGISPEVATYYTAAISGLSSLSRAAMAFPSSFSLSSSSITNLSFCIMIITSAVFAFSKEQSIWLPMLMIFSIANGVGNYGVFAQISDTLSEVIGLASGLSGATGAISAFFISIAFASLESTNSDSGTAFEYLIATAFCSLSLVLNIAHEYKRNTSDEAQDFEPISSSRMSI